MAVAVEFRYALVEINKKEVLVERKKFDDAAKPLKKVLKKSGLLTEADLKIGFALETPEGMSPLRLGTANDFSNWVTEKMKADFKLEASIEKLPDPFNTGLKALVNTELVIYSAVLFWTGDTKNDQTKNRFYGELVIGFQVPEWFMEDFPVALREIVIAVNNYPPPKPKTE
ncbi:MAG: hypothetical protein WAM70_02755 [Pyrinomonadaceae bacterium]